MTIFFENGFRGVVWSNDYPPPHLHVQKDGKGAVFSLEHPDCDEIVASPELTSRERRTAKLLARKYYETALREWNELHGKAKQNL